MGQDWIDARKSALRARALAVWAGVKGLRVMGNPEADNQLPIFSFCTAAPDGQPVNIADFTQHLSDHYGIQARGGCSCARPYGHSLLQIDPNVSAYLFAICLTKSARAMRWRSPAGCGWTCFIC